MNKILTLCFSMLLVSAELVAQQVNEGQQPFKRKESANALYVEVEGQQKNIEHILEEKFNTKTGKKSKNDKGVRKFESARMTDISTSTMNYYYDVEKKKGQGNMNTVRLFIASGPKNFLNSDENPGEMLAAREILENLQYETTVYEFELAVDEQQKLLSKEEKNYDNMVKDSVKLEKRLEDTLVDIEKNKSDRENQILLLAEEQEKLDALKDEMEAFIRGRGDWRNTNTRGKN